MAANNFPISFSFIAALLAAIFTSANGSERKDHIVYMGAIQNRAMAESTHHLNLLQSVIGTSSVTEDSYIRSYGRSFNGFVAELTGGEAEQLAAMDGVVSVFESKELKTKTTRSWDFLGFQQPKRNLAGELDVIIGSIDSGIWPESESFNDEGMGPPPQKWRGECAGGENFTCNHKVIGARYYSSSSARDDKGHGTHTASTAIGKSVTTDGFYGIAGGVARGAVPSSRLAVYSACSPSCTDVEILAAFDDAIADGVDIITISLGGFDLSDLRVDCIAIGAYHAMVKGILTVQSAGNDGPVVGSVESVAPWLFSVAATTTDRSIVDEIVLGNGKTVSGYSINPFTPNKDVPLIYGTNASKSCSFQNPEVCSCLDPKLVKGKIVQCKSFAGIFKAVDAGAAGAIVLNDKADNVSFIVPLPAIALNLTAYEQVANYAISEPNPHVRILQSVAVKDGYAPMAAQFSSRGPNLLLPEIMKPDIAAPGVEILASVNPQPPNSDTPGDNRTVNFTIMSGTSMACPHVAGLAAYVKSFHPNWSPSAIKSAIMTTAEEMTNTDGFLSGEFLHGSGQIDPKQAIEPGLVYEIFEDDYLKFLCGNGFDSKSVRGISGNKSDCSKFSTKFSPQDLNYPAMVFEVPPMKPFAVKFQRTVTNVGIANSTYKSEFSPLSVVYVLKSSEKLNVSVEPPELTFRDLNEKKSFVVTVAGGSIPARTGFSSALIWSDGIHKVRSPMVLNVKLPPIPTSN
ncbi:subtilisin-like protease SBT4.3 [Cucurbita pepo subsp. pepo]|uniref:subtilisin-like protease SBT4.3 n=1 Tax=Cucurbita pepo subsp. pepo TaxID=3664 RepID=UPI000C9D8B97|nr:subtilisin-like protease SBT4.3 [Cucurbita pepo subsp. pepo]